uniref:Ig-like domain-containing protein n=2 Tax=Iconisemion striatum TaxID=60296 RepID=A0A1A7WGK7_9TELE
MLLLDCVAQVLWRCAGLLLSSVCLCAALGKFPCTHADYTISLKQGSDVCHCQHVCAEPRCVLGIVGSPVTLPCVSSALLTSGNFSIEWMKDDKVVLRTAWKMNENLGTWSLDPATIPADAALTGNFSLTLSAVHPRDDGKYYSLLFLSGKNQSVQLCSACLRVAASFSDPLLKRKHTAEGDGTTFQCHSEGGYPQPEVSWLIDTQEPPEGSVRTQTDTLPDGHLYNITSKLTISLPKDVSVTCIIENLSMNETLRSTCESIIISVQSEARIITLITASCCR